MNIKPEELKAHGYELIERLDHMELIPFVRKYMKTKTRFSLIYISSNVLIALSILFYFWKNYGVSNFIIGDGLTYLCYGFAIAFTLVPIHEYIHALAYKSQGAATTSFDANWKKFYFMAIADKFVASKKEFQIIALAPFITINLILIIMILFTGKLWTFTILGILLTHTAFCSGDFGLLSFFDLNEDKNVVTYDDKENKVSYFYGRKA